MSDTYLLISDPPHGDVEAEPIAQQFGFTPAEALMLVQFPGPEIWFADSDLAVLKATGAALQRAGVRVRIINGSLMSQIPVPMDLQSFLLDETGFTAQLESGALTAPYQAHAILVVSRLKLRPSMSTMKSVSPLGHHASEAAAAEVGATAMGGAEEAVDMPTCDAYFISESRVQRATLRSGKVSFEGLGADLKMTDESNRRELIDQFRARFRKTDVDERLLDIDAPKPFLRGGKGLPEILGNIDPELKALTSADMLSRLAMLCHL